MNLNRAMIIGNLTRDPEIRNTPSGLPVASFAVATNRVWTDKAGQKQEKVEFHNVVAWRRLAEICGQYLKKGAKVYIEGRLQTNDWAGQDGVKRYRTEIVVENMIMLDRAGSTQSAAAGQYSTPASAPAPAQTQEQPAVANEPVIDVEEPTSAGNEENPSEEEIKVESIPF